MDLYRKYNFVHFYKSQQVVRKDEKTRKRKLIDVPHVEVVKTPEFVQEKVMKYKHSFTKNNCLIIKDELDKECPSFGISADESDIYCMLHKLMTLRGIAKEDLPFYEAIGVLLAYIDESVNDIKKHNFIFVPKSVNADWFIEFIDLADFVGIIKYALETGDNERLEASVGQCRMGCMLILLKWIIYH